MKSAIVIVIIVVVVVVVVNAFIVVRSAASNFDTSVSRCTQFLPHSDMT